MDLPNTERELLIEALRTVERMSGLLNDISARSYAMAGDKEPDEALSNLLNRRFSDCSGVGLFIAAEALQIALPDDLANDYIPS